MFFLAIVFPSNIISSKGTLPFNLSDNVSITSPATTKSDTEIPSSVLQSSSFIIT